MSLFRNFRPVPGTIWHNPLKLRCVENMRLHENVLASQWFCQGLGEMASQNFSQLLHMARTMCPDVSLSGIQCGNSVWNLRIYVDPCPDQEHASHVEESTRHVASWPDGLLWKSLVWHRWHKEGHSFQVFDHFQFLGIQPFSLPASLLFCFCAFLLLLFLFLQSCVFATLLISAPVSFAWFIRACLYTS